MVSNGHLTKSTRPSYVTCVCITVYWSHLTLRLLAFLKCVFFTCLIACSHACTSAQRTLHRIGPCANLTKVPTPPSLCLYSQCFSSVRKPTRKTKVKKMCFAQNPQSMANVSHVPSKRAAALLAVPPSTTIAPSSLPLPGWTQLYKNLNV